jgi:hypothetical protein
MNRERKVRKTYHEFVNSTQYQRKQTVKQRELQRKQVRRLANG